MDWATALTTSGVTAFLLGIAAWLGRGLVIERLKNAVRYEFDEKLERLRAEIRRNEESLASIRSTALAAMSSHQSGLDVRRLRAVDDLWQATMALKVGTAAVKIIGTLRLEKIGTPDASVQQLVGLFSPFQQAFLDVAKDSPRAETARPFVTPVAWAFYTAYSAIVLQAALQFNSLKNGDDPIKYINTSHTLELVKAALPDLAPLLDRYGYAAYPDILPDLEERLLAELRASAAGRESDQEGVARARKVAALAAKADDRASALQRPSEPDST